MSWKKKKYTQGKNEFYSISKKLRRDKKINEDFEIMMNGLLLEEVIALKLELATKAAGGALYGIPLWYSIKDIVKDAIFKYAYSATKTKMEASRFLGITMNDFQEYSKFYSTESYFEEEKDDEKSDNMS